MPASLIVTISFDVAFRPLHRYQICSDGFPHLTVVASAARDDLLFRLDDVGVV
jgi:hypothetical protein